MNQVRNHGKRMGLLRATAIVALGTITTVLGLTGCSGFFTAIDNNPGGGASSFAYVTHTGGTLAEYSLTSGVLASLSGSPITVPVLPTAIAVSPNNDFVYVGTGTGVFLYTVNSDGTLTEGNNNTIIYLNTGLSSPVIRSMVVDPTSSWLIMAYQNSTELDALQVDPTSGLPVTSTAYSPSVPLTYAAPNPELAISSANKQVFAALGTGGTNAFGFNPKSSTSPWGSTVAIPLAAANTSDNAVAVDPSSTYLFVAEANNSTATSAGKVRMIATANLGTDLGAYTTGVGPSAVLADLSGAYVYVANQTDGTISGYTITKASNSLTAMAATFPTTASPIALVEDHSKTYVMALGGKGNPNFWLYNFDTTTNDGTLDITSTKSTSTSNPALANGIAVTY
jgi:6-phosphogluconolactonase